MILIVGNGPNKRNTLKDIGDWFGGRPVQITIDPGCDPKVVSQALEMIAAIINDASSLEREAEDDEDDD